MALDSLLTSLSVEALGIEIYGFIDGTDPCYKNKNISDSSCSETTSKSSNTADGGEELLSKIQADEGKFVEATLRFLNNPSSNCIIAHICKDPDVDTNGISYPHMDSFDNGKNIWCSCVEYSQSSWEAAIELRENRKLLTKSYGGESEDYFSNKGATNSFSSYDHSSNTQEQKGNADYGPASSKQDMSMCSLQTLMLNNSYGKYKDEGSSSRAPSPVPNLINFPYENTSIMDDYTHLLYNEYNPSVSNILAMNPDTILHLMGDQYGCSSLKEIIPLCNHSQLKIIVDKISFNSNNLINIACTDIGSRSLQGFIKKLKKLNLAMPITQALSSGCYVMMINHFGRRVIQHCFNYLDCNENKILYEEVIHNCIELGIDKDGCLSLNSCIDTIKGPLRGRLFDVISDHTLYLSFDPYGTFVIQHVLELHNPKYCDKICDILEGNYVTLSHVYSGSHLVEKCLQSSKLGLIYLMDEITTNNGMLETLAKHEFGNYVIQQALLVSQGTNAEYYRYLTKNLVRILPILENIKYGKKLANLLRGLIQGRF